MYILGADKNIAKPLYKATIINTNKEEIIVDNVIRAMANSGLYYIETASGTIYTYPLDKVNSISFDL